MKSFALLAAPVVLLCATGANAAPKPKPKRSMAPAAAAPAPDVHLAIAAPTTRGPWTMRVTNDGSIPVRIVADARALWLEVTPRSARKATRCELPGDMRPGDDLQQPLVLPPGRSYAESFEPRLYCFGRAQVDALAPGAIVVAHLGWPGKADKPPFSVSPIDGVEPRVAPMRAIAAPAIALPDEPTAVPAPSPPPLLDADAYPPKLDVTAPTAIDAPSATGLSIPVTLHNDGTRTVIVRFRPETLAFEVTGATGVENCAWPALPSAPMRELFLRLPPKGTSTQAVTLATYCTGHALDQAGLVVVRPRLDTRQASGADIGLHTFDGEVIAMMPTIVRLHHGLAAAPLRHPSVEPQATPAAPPAAAAPASLAAPPVSR